MSFPTDNLLIRRPTSNDAQAVTDFLIAGDIAAYGEPDSDLESLLDEWADIDLSQDAWLAVTEQGQIAGYAAVFRFRQRFTFNIYIQPTLAPASLFNYLVAQCEARACGQLEVDAKATAVIYVAHVHKAERDALEKLGYELVKYHAGMRISLDGPPPEPNWPEGVSLRTAVPGQDDHAIYDFIQTAFDWPGRTPPTFERWRELMMDISNFEAELWFLAYHGSELVGAALCFDYPQNGWVRQLGVAQAWRRKGLGAALLQHVFGVFQRRGHIRVGLVVDSDNPKAFTFYERVGMQQRQQYLEYLKTLPNN